MTQAGHKCIAVIGGETALIGDPSGKNKERSFLPVKTIYSNIYSIEKQVRFIIGRKDLVIKNNRDWFRDIGISDFLNMPGKYFRVNKMITEEPTRSRIASGEGISFLEFSYKLLQAYDFHHLYKFSDCRIQVGGKDQRSNILAGIDLVRKKDAGEVAGMFCPLLTDSRGKKIGKTMDGETIWLSPELTDPFDFYQFWVRQVDSDITKMLLAFTTIPEGNFPKGPAARNALAFYMTELVHGTKIASDCIIKTEALFKNKDVTAMKEKKVEKGEINIASLFLLAGLTKSKAEGKRLAVGSGLKINGVTVKDADTVIELISTEEVILQRGKKRFKRIIAE